MALLKSEEEVKEYLENLGTEYKFSCFKEKNAEGCHLLADYLESVKANFDAARKVFKSNCEEHGFPKSCFKYGTYSLIGKAMDPNCLEAYNHFKKSCELGYNDGCLYTGVMLTSTESSIDHTAVPLDPAEGMKYLEKACNGGSANACYYGSNQYLRGSEEVPKDAKKALRMGQMACEKGNIFSCMNVSQMYKLGDGVEKSQERSEFYKQKAKDIRDDHKKKQSLGLQQYT